jgi:hypothetical protein
MAHAIAITHDRETFQTPARPLVQSFDSGYEHSPEHLLAVRNMVEEADEEPATPAWLYAMGIKA